MYSPASAAGVARTVAATIKTKNILGVYERGLHIPSLLQPGQSGPFAVFVDPLLLQETHGKADGETARLCQHLTWASVAVDGTRTGNALSAIVYHELFHAAQFAEIKLAPTFDNWWFEASATAAESWFGSQDHAKYAHYVTGDPTMPMDTFGMGHEYGAYLFVQSVLKSSTMPTSAGWAFLQASIEDVVAHKPNWDDGLDQALEALPPSPPCPSPTTLLGCDVASFWADETNPTPRFGPAPKFNFPEVIKAESESIKFPSAKQFGANLISLKPASDKNKMEVIIPSVPSGMEVWVNLGGGELKRVGHGQDFDETFCRGGEQGPGTYPLPKTGDVRIASTTTGSDSPPELEVKALASADKCQQAGITMFQHSVNDGRTPAATFESAACSRPAAGKTGVFKAKATSGPYTLRVTIQGFDGFKTYHLHYQATNPTFVVDGPGGPFSNTYWPGGTPPSQGGAITFSNNGLVMGLGFIDAFDSTFSDDIVLAGTLACNYSNH